MNNCVICRGAKSIRLPVHQELSLRAYSDSAMPSAMDMVESSRSYPCPECSDGDAPKGIALCTATQVVDEFTMMQSKGDVVEHVKRNLAHEIAAFLLKEGFIDFKQSKIDFGTKITAKVGVASAEAAKRIDNDVTARAAEMLNGIADAAGKKIYQWGSHYSGNGGMIEKGMAARFVDEAFADHMRKAQEALRS